MALRLARLLEIVGGQLLVAEMREGFAQLARVQVAGLLSLLRALHLLEPGAQGLALLPAGGLARRAKVQFRAGDARGGVSPEVAADLFGVRVQGGDFGARGGYLGGQRLQALQLGFLLQLAHAEKPL